MLAALGQAGGVGGRLRASAHAQLREQVRHVVLDRLLGQEELLAYLTVGHPLSDQVEDPAFLVRETRKLVGLWWLAQPLQHPGGHQRVEEGLTTADPADSVDKIGAAHLLQHVAGRSREDRAEQRFVVCERGEHQARDFGVL